MILATVDASQISSAAGQNVLVRDLAIAVGIVIVLVIIRIPLSIRRRHKRHEAAQRRQHDEAQPGGADPIPGLAALAASKGWAGPTTDPQFDNSVTDYTHEMLRNLWGHPRGADQDIPIDSSNRFTNVFHGTAAGLAFTIANTRLNVSRSTVVGFHLDRSQDPWASVCAIELPLALPPLYVNLHDRAGYRGLFLKHCDFESEQFNRTFDVMTVNPKLANDVITPPVMELLLTRDDWAFSYQMGWLICLCSHGLHTAADYQQRVDVLARLVDLVPEFVADDDALKLPTLPDGTVLSPNMSEDEMKEVGEKIMALNPEQRTAFLREAQFDAMEGLAQMFGKHIDEDKLRAAIDQNIAKHPPT